MATVRIRLHAASSVLSTSLWIAICAAAPEIIWRGFWASIHHFSRSDLLSALIVGLVLAFFIEPLLERVRRLIGYGPIEDRQARGPIFMLCLSVAFALMSVCLHDALTTFMAGDEPGTGVDTAIILEIGWAIVPLLVTASWMSHGLPFLAIGLGVFAVLSPFLTAWLFSWSLESAIYTAIPTLFILLLGYSRKPSRSAFTASAVKLSIIAALWLTLAAATNEATRLYTSDELWIDLRFYFGWVAGLLLAPYPDHRANDNVAR